MRPPGNFASSERPSGASRARPPTPIFIKSESKPSARDMRQNWLVKITARRSVDLSRRPADCRTCWAYTKTPCWRNGMWRVFSSTRADGRRLSRRAYLPHGPSSDAKKCASNFGLSGNASRSGEFGHGRHERRRHYAGVSVMRSNQSEPLAQSTRCGWPMHLGQREEERHVGEW